MVSNTLHCALIILKMLLLAKGVRMIDEKPRYGAGGSSIAFLHPKATGGVLLELCQRMK